MPAILFYIIFAVLIIISIHSKQNLHIDEVFSYGLSNYSKGINPVFEDGVIYEPASKVFTDYMTVSPDSRFNYSNVWKNQANDVHPPMYYALLHTICSFFMGRFSVWYAGIINVFFSMVLLFFLRKIIDLIVPGNVFFKTSISLVFVLSSGILSANTFLRMYVMAMTFCLIFTYLVIKKQKRTDDSHFWIKFSITLIFGALTHYYCIIYDVLLCVALGIYFISNKMKTDTKMLIITSFLSGGISIAIFPFILKHVFFSSRGRQTIRNAITFSISNYLSRLSAFFSLINYELFGGILLALAVFIIIRLIYISKKTEKKTMFDNCRSLLCIAVATIAFFVVIAKWAVFIEDRYMYVIYPEIFIVVMISAYFTICDLIKNSNARKSIWIVIMLIITIGSFTFTYWNYTYWYPNEKTIDQLIDSSSDKNAVCIYNESWEVQYLYKDLENLKSVLFIQENEIENMMDYVNDGSVLYVSGFLQREDIEEVLRKKFVNLDTYLLQFTERGYVYYLK